MKIEEIKKEALEYIEEENKSEYVGKYVELLRLEKQTKKQLESVQKRIKEFEEDPEKFVEQNEDLW